MAAKFPVDYHEYKCPVCTMLYQDPRVLPCLHTYCKRCLEKMLDEGKIQCPECRDIFEIEDVASLKVNFWIEKSLAFQELYKAEKAWECKREVTCAVCDSKDPATARCFDCEKFVCDGCIKVHQRIESLKDHQIISLEEIKSKGIPVVEKKLFCKKHKDEKMKLFCKTCKELICRDCTIIEHRAHDYCFAEDTIDEQKENITKVISNANEMKKDVETGLKSLEKMEVRVKQKSVSTEKTIDNAINKQIRALEEKRERLKEELKNKTERDMRKLIAKEDGLVSQLTSLTNAIEFTENLLANGSNAEVIELSNDVSKRLSQLSQLPVDDEHDDEVQVPVLRVSDDLLSNGIEEFVSLSVPDPAECKAKWSQDSGQDIIEIHIKDDRGYSLNVSKSRITIHNVPDESRNMHLETFLFVQGHENSVWTVTYPFIHPTQPGCGSIVRHTQMVVNIKVDGRSIGGNPIHLCIVKANKPNSRRRSRR